MIKKLLVIGYCTGLGTASALVGTLDDPNNWEPFWFRILDIFHDVSELVSGDRAGAIARHSDRAPTDFVDVLAATVVRADSTEEELLRGVVLSPSGRFQILSSISALTHIAHDMMMNSRPAEGTFAGVVSCADTNIHALIDARLSVNDEPMDDGTYERISPDLLACGLDSNPSSMQDLDDKLITLVGDRILDNKFKIHNGYARIVGLLSDLNRSVVPRDEDEQRVGRTLSWLISLTDDALREAASSRKPANQERLRAYEVMWIDRLPSMPDSIEALPGIADELDATRSWAKQFIYHEAGKDRLECALALTTIVGRWVNSIMKSAAPLWSESLPQLEANLRDQIEIIQEYRDRNCQLGYVSQNLMSRSDLVVTSSSTTAWPDTQLPHHLRPDPFHRRAGNSTTP